MKNILLTLTFLLVIPVIGFAQTDVSQPACGLPFDSYNQKTTWNEERAHLYNFAYYLKQEPEFIGYIYIFTQKDEPLKNTKTRSNRIIKYLTKDIGSGLEVEKSRIVFIYKTDGDISEIILQLISKGSKPPEF